MSHLRELYQEVIIDHNKNPRHFYVLDNPSFHAKGYNPLCGDEVAIYLQVNTENCIEKVSFTGHGCAISMASASLMTEILQGKKIEDASKLFHEFHELITTEKPIDIDELGKLAVFAGVREFPARVKCATLAWHAFNAALHQNIDPISTE